MTQDGVTASSTDLSVTLKAGVRTSTAASLGVEVIHDGLFAEEFKALGRWATVSLHLH